MAKIQSPMVSRQPARQMILIGVKAIGHHLIIGVSQPPVPHPRTCLAREAYPEAEVVIHNYTSSEASDISMTRLKDGRISIGWIQYVGSDTDVRMALWEPRNDANNLIDDGSGNDFIQQFQNGLDKFNFASHTLVNSMANLTITNSGGDAYVTFNGGGQFIAFGSAGLIDASDFVFA